MNRTVSRVCTAAALAVLAATTAAPVSASEPTQRDGITTELHEGAAAPSIAAVAGYPKGKYVSYAPFRFIDTRANNKPLGPRGTSTMQFTGGVPKGATAVVFNLTATDVTADTFISVFPAGQPRSSASAINLTKGMTRSNQVVVPLGSDAGKPAISFYNNAGSAHVIGDLSGFYSSSQEGATGYGATAPKRVLDTRSGDPVGPGKETVLDLSKQVPDGVNAVTLNITGIAHSGNTYLTAYPDGTSRPTGSSVNIDAGDTTPNFVTVGLSQSKKLRIYNNNGSTDVLADLSGYYGGDGTASYQPVAPTRIADTRSSGGPLGPHGVRTVTATGAPSDSPAATVNLTGITPTVDTHLDAYAANAQRPDTSNLNLKKGQILSNMANIPLGDGKFAVYNANGSTHLVADLSGYFVP